MSTPRTGLPKLITNLMLMRADLLRKLNNEKRNFNKEFGYPESVDIANCIDLIKRDPIAARINSLYPEECWAMPPSIRETNDEQVTTQFEKDLEAYIPDEESGRVVLPGRDLLHFMQRGDIECGKGHYGALLIGVGDGKTLDQPVVGFGEDGGKLYDAMFFKVFHEGEIVISEYDRNENSVRYCRPTQYQITYNGLNELNTVVSSANISIKAQKVHWHRIVHLVDNVGSNEIAGDPRLEVYYNSILDLRKLYGGSAEMFWKGGLPGWSVETLPEVAGNTEELEPEAKEALKLEFQAWQDGLQRVLMLQNMSLKDHSPQLASPQYHILAQLQRIAFGLGCPLRILLGAEEARLASNQDTRNWNKKLARRNRNQTTPNVVVPSIQQMVHCRTLTKPQQLQVVWPDLNSPTAEDKADLAVKRMTALTKYVQTGASLVMGYEFFLIHEMGYSKDLAELCLKDRETKPFIPKPEGAIVSPNKQRTERASGISKAASTSSL